MRNLRSYLHVIVIVCMLYIVICSIACAPKVPPKRSSNDSSGSVVDEGGKRQPKIGYYELTLYTKNGWRLDIGEKGAGSILYGAGPNYGEDCPTGTFDFAKLVNYFDRPNGSDANDGGGITVFLFPNSDHIAVTRPVQDVSYIFELFKKAHDAAKSPPDSDVARLWKQTPPATQATNPPPAP